MNRSLLFYKSLLVFALCSSTIISCNKTEEVIVFECPIDALFSKENASGLMLYLSCYDAWSIKMDEVNGDNFHLIAASKDIPEAFKIEGLHVTFTACFYEFDLPLLFPDPVLFGEMYVIKDFEIQEAK